MYHHFKKLMHTVGVDEPDPRFGNMLLEQFGGANGELAAAMQYSVQGLTSEDASTLQSGQRLVMSAARMPSVVGFGNGKWWQPIIESRGEFSGVSGHLGYCQECLQVN